MARSVQAEVSASVIPRSRAAEFGRLLLPYGFAVLVHKLAISSDHQLKIFNAAE